MGVALSKTRYSTGARPTSCRHTKEFLIMKKTFILSKKYPSRPRFEDDDMIVEAFTDYGERMDKIISLRRQLERLGV